MTNVIELLNQDSKKDALKETEAIYEELAALTVETIRRKIEEPERYKAELDEEPTSFEKAVNSHTRVMASLDLLEIDDRIKEVFETLIDEFHTDTLTYWCEMGYERGFYRAASIFGGEVTEDGEMMNGSGEKVSAPNRIPYEWSPSDETIANRNEIESYLDKIACLEGQRGRMSRLIEKYAVSMGADAYAAAYLKCNKEEDDQ
jgi:hypothetical protein